MKVISIYRDPNTAFWWLYLKINKSTYPTKISKEDAEHLREKYNLRRVENENGIWYKSKDEKTPPQSIEGLKTWFKNDEVKMCPVCNTRVTGFSTAVSQSKNCTNVQFIHETNTQICVKEFES